MRRRRDDFHFLINTRADIEYSDSRKERGVGGETRGYPRLYESYQFSAASI
ncbi:hypothetical protein S1OALGB6SA_916 [Olavius algarvensis spirochete endosymbiont]|nr:MAG: hypothetical protein [Olavius algarvensis spirochete endosymbiont]VDA99843.1 hypothetical protein S1OALGB6SA_916 [Olavius algarvensis spirochete endosymbiont]